MGLLKQGQSSQGRIAALNGIIAIAIVLLLACTSVDQEECSSRIAVSYMNLMSLGGLGTRDAQAVKRGRDELLQALKDCPIPERGLEVELMGRWTRAELAIAANDIDWVVRNMELVRHQVSASGNISESNSLMHVAAGYATRPLVELLLANGLDVNQRDLGGDTPLMASVFVGLQDGTENTEALLQAGADANAIADNGTTALYYAVFTDDARHVALLLRHGARVHPKGPGDDSIVRIARRRGRPDILALIQNAEMIADQ